MECDDDFVIIDHTDAYSNRPLKTRQEPPIDLADEVDSPAATPQRHTPAPPETPAVPEETRAEAVAEKVGPDLNEPIDPLDPEVEPLVDATEGVVPLVASPVAKKAEPTMHGLSFLLVLVIFTIVRLVVESMVCAAAVKCAPAAPHASPSSPQLAVDACRSALF